jgi:hypothetical protein
VVVGDHRPGSFTGLAGCVMTDSTSATWNDTDTDADTTETRLPWLVACSILANVQPCIFPASSTPQNRCCCTAAGAIVSWPCLFVVLPSSEVAPRFQNKLCGATLAARCGSVCAHHTVSTKHCKSHHDDIHCIFLSSLRCPDPSADSLLIHTTLFTCHVQRRRRS